MLAVDVHDVSPAVRWRAATRIGFRFVVVYFGLYILTTQMLSGLIVLPVGNLPDLQDLPPVRTIVSWVAAHVFRVTAPLVITGSGSGDKTFDWVHAFCVLVGATVATALWSSIDRRRLSYGAIDRWFRLFARFALGSTMLGYGFAKVIPIQMPYPHLTRLVERYGDFSPMGALWYFIGASPAYETLVGCAEVAGGLLVLIPQTAMLGALICLADAIQIFALNMTYDVPVKLFAFHLIALSAVLLAPDAPRLLNVFVLNRTAYPSTQQPLGKTARRMRIGVAAQLLVALYLVGVNVYGARQSWAQYGGGAPKSALYGIWSVDQMSIDGQIRSPLTTDYDRWQRLIFDRPALAAFQRMDGTLVFFGAKIDASASSLTLTNSAAPAWTARFAFTRPATDRLVLDGEMDGRTVHLQMSSIDRNSFLLVNRGFHWVQEYPFNR